MSAQFNDGSANFVPEKQYIELEAAQMDIKNKNRIYSLKIHWEQRINLNPHNIANKLCTYIVKNNGAFTFKIILVAPIQ